MNASDLTRRFGAVFGAVALLGAGAPDPQEAMGGIAFVMSLAPQAQASAGKDDVQSFRGKIRMGRAEMAADGVIEMVAVKRGHGFEVKSTFSADSSSIYMVGTTSYVQLRDRNWMKFDVARYITEHPDSPASRDSAAPKHPTPFDGPHHVLPDRRVDGVLMGAFSVRSPASLFDKHLPASQIVTTTCLYEKATGRPRACNTPNLFAMTLDHYNDPANRFTLPAAALNAPDAYSGVK